MGSNQTMDKIIGNQRAVISRIFPYGIVNPHLIFGPSDNETRNLRLAYKAIKGKNLLLEMPVDQHAAKSKMVYRDFLSEKAYRAYFYDSDDFEKWEKTKYMTIRGPETAETIMRWTRIADAQLFLAGAGVSTIFDAITQGFDPFIFGKIGFSEIRERESYTRLFWQALTEQATSCTKTLSEAAKNGELKSVFLPALMLHPQQDGQDKEKWSNNTVGVLLDLKNHSAYAVYRFQPFQKTWYWAEKEYSHLNQKVLRVLDKIGIKEARHDYHALDAIILIDRKSEYANALRLAEIIPDKTCFGSVRVIQMNQEGISQLKRILASPSSEINDFDLMRCLELFPNISQISTMFGVRLIETNCRNFDGHLTDDVFCGLDFDLLKVTKFAKKTRNKDGSLPRIVVFPSQKDLFLKLSFGGSKIVQSTDQLLVHPYGLESATKGDDESKSGEEQTAELTKNKLLELTDEDTIDITELVT